MIIIWPIVHSSGDYRCYEVVYLIYLMLLVLMLYFVVLTWSELYLEIIWLGGSGNEIPVEVIMAYLWQSVASVSNTKAKTFSPEKIS